MFLLFVNDWRGILIDIFSYFYHHIISIYLHSISKAIMLTTFEILPRVFLSSQHILWNFFQVLFLWYQILGPCYSGKKKERSKKLDCRFSWVLTIVRFESHISKIFDLMLISQLNTRNTKWFWKISAIRSTEMDIIFFCVVFSH